MTKKSRRYAELAIGFWLGIGLMSIINIWKIKGNRHAVAYDWIMFGVSVVILIIAIALLYKKEKVGKNK
jgi:phosphate starvation-inducible membrane PsiE